MPSTKSFLVLVVIIGVLAGLMYNNSVRQKHLSQVALAKELHKAMGAMMTDLRQGRAGSVKGVPADGKWHHEIAFSTIKEGAIEYRLSGESGSDLNRTSAGVSQTIAAHIGTLNLRRQAADNSLMEVQLQARNNLSLTSNFKIRMQE